MPSESNELKSMAALLRSGATLTGFPCPACSSPLFRLKSGELWCAKCKKRVVVVKEDEGATGSLGSILLENLESTLLTKIQDINDLMRNEYDPERLGRLSSVLSTMLESLERIRRIKKQASK